MTERDDLTKRERLRRAAYCVPVDRPPVWLMRQAGRFLPEYRALKEQYSFLERCKTPALCRDITLQPLTALDVDAVIIFQDILTPLEPLGIALEIGEGGPKILNPVRTWGDLGAMPMGDLGETTMGYVAEAHRLIRASIGPEVGQIGFAGAPYTLAVYLVEGVPTKDHKEIRALRWRDAALFRAVLEHLGQAMVPYLVMQAEAGADLLMIFDTWAQDLSPEDFQQFVVPVVKAMVAAIHAQTDVPVVYFPRGINGYWREALAIEADVLGFDHGIRLGQVRQALGPRPAVQGNINPALLYAHPEAITATVQALHKSMNGAPGHIFNLGHGVWPDTPVSGAQALVRAVQGLAVPGGGLSDG